MSIIQQIKYTKLYLYKFQNEGFCQQLSPKQFARAEIRLLVHEIENSHDAKYINECLYNIAHKPWLSYYNVVELQILQLNIEKALSLWQDYTVIRDKKYTTDLIQIMIDLYLRQNLNNCPAN